VRPLRARYTPEAAAIIRKIHPGTKRLVREGIRALIADPLLGHELQLELAGFRSYRVKGYRIIYALNESGGSLDVHVVGQRRDVYQSFRDLLTKRLAPDEEEA
jgi:mRNA-degrading endonuclease RelE of RelBE toxin-antitoxin system